MALTADSARAVLAQAKADETYEGPIPEDDETAISEATELVDQARAAWDENVRGPQVEAILSLAVEDDEAGSEPEAEGDGDGDEDEVDYTIEPWEDYDGEKLPDIKAALEWSLENEPDNFPLLARHVWEYESANKERKGLLDFLAQLAGGEGGDDDAPTEDEAASGDEGEAGEAEAGSGDEGGDADGEGDGEEDPAPAGADEPDADADASGEAGEAGGEAEPEAEPAKPKRGAAKSKVKLTLTREQVLEALASGSVEIG